MKSLIYEHHPLTDMTTFGVPAHARFLVALKQTDDIPYILGDVRFAHMPIMILGGGSNILFTKDFEGCIIKNEISYLDILSETDDHVIVSVGAGYDWHDFVMYATERGWGGVENLALIPGTVGAAPVQNIGAYGIEVAETIVSIDVYNRVTGNYEELLASDCAFGYRTSIFKTTARDTYIITGVVFRLSKNAQPRTTYAALVQYLDEQNISHPSLIDIRDAVIAIRRSKLPDPRVLGNAGSFFKNPYITQDAYHALLAVYPDMPSFEADADHVKVPAAFLIDRAGWKGRRIGAVGVHDKQALVIVHYGGGTGQDIVDLAHAIQADVFEKYGIHIEPEVNVW
ncbi:MAG: UDP-N-acetylmuramate dehydrogenase [Candidatus Pacebacteria bacterium]|nr:UDP-N-acetylmuramate dehydrogenase [Candidatus Paceibacterota bacterium]MCD8507863.1 UDP-N-acetylmuramate dehydrogenase [Candidatus Paceibacterota bacterium]MCD8563542.1 UDP-N-acetylmuramate dehydrogenase [Candidatus Paceibacterota bacterium]